jgi:hypothetical protein
VEENGAMVIGAVREPRIGPLLRPELPAVAGNAVVAGPERPSVFAGVLRGLSQEVQRGESLVTAAIGAARGRREISPGELIALQAGVYRYGEAIDLASRLIDRATSSVKTVLQGQ